MAEVSAYTDSVSGKSKIEIVLSQSADKIVIEEIREALISAAQKYVENNMDKITAKLDMSGLGNLIALYAAKKIAEDMKGTK